MRTLMVSFRSFFFSFFVVLFYVLIDVLLQKSIVEVKDTSIFDTA